MAAPLGFKTFVTGDVLTAADTNGYLMQGIWTFANATARDAAVTSPQEGNTCYLKDTDVIQVYSGSAWVTKSGSSPLTTKGDVYTYSTTDARLAVGANDTVLTADSTAATGLKWATPTSGGMTLISTTTLSGATVTLSSIPQTYNSLFMVVSGVTNATADGNFRIAPNGSATISSQFGTNATATVTSFTDEYIRFNSGNMAITRTLSTNSWSVQIDNYTSTTGYKPFNTRGGFVEVTTSRATSFAGQIATNSAISSLVFSNAGGNLSTGTVLLYGVK